MPLGIEKVLTTQIGERNEKGLRQGRKIAPIQTRFQGLSGRREAPEARFFFPFCARNSHCLIVLLLRIRVLNHTLRNERDSQSLRGIQ